MLHVEVQFSCCTEERPTKLLNDEWPPDVQKREVRLHYRHYESERGGVVQRKSLSKERPDSGKLPERAKRSLSPAMESRRFM